MEMATVAAGGHLPAEKLYGKERSCVLVLKTWQGRNMSVRMDGEKQMTLLTKSDWCFRITGIPGEENRHGL